MSVCLSVLLFVYLYSFLSIHLYFCNQLLSCLSVSMYVWKYFCIITVYVNTYTQSLNKNNRIFVCLSVCALRSLHMYQWILRLGKVCHQHNIVLRSEVYILHKIHFFHLLQFLYFFSS